MSYPEAYTRQYDYMSYQNSNPTRPLPADKLHVDLNLLASTTQEIIDFIAGIARSDGALANGIVTRDSLATEILVGFNSPTAWATATAYTTADTVFESGNFYRCATNHTSGVFATDLAAGLWVLIATLLADDSVETAALVDGAVTTPKIADDAVTTPKIADSNVTTAKIADSNVTTAKIADSNVTTAKVNDSAVTTAKIADSNVTTAKIADSNVTNAKLANSAAYTLKGNATGSSAAPTDFTIPSLTAKASPASGDSVMIADGAAGGALKKVDATAFASGRTRLTADTTLYLRTAPVAVTISNASPAVVTHAAHGYSAGQAVVFNSTSSLPTGITAGIPCYVISAGLTSGSYQVSATPGGAAINTSSAGSGTFTVSAGNDTSGTGATQTATDAFITLQGAINYVQKNIDLSIYKLTIQAAGAGGGGTSLYKPAIISFPCVGGNPAANVPSLVIQGDTTTPSNCVISATTGTGYVFAAEQNANVTIQGFKISSTTNGGVGLKSDTGANLWWNAMDFGSMSGTGNTQHINAHAQGRAYCLGNYTISGSSKIHMAAERMGFIEINSVTVTLSGTPGFTGAFAYVDNKGTIYSGSVTFSGSATGPRHYAQNLGLLINPGGSVTYYPGDSAGTPSSAGSLGTTGGLYATS